MILFTLRFLRGEEYLGESLPRRSEEYEVFETKPSLVIFSDFHAKTTSFWYTLFTRSRGVLRFAHEPESGVRPRILDCPSFYDKESQHLNRFAL